MPYDTLREVRVEVSRRVKPGKMLLPAVSAVEFLSTPLNVRLIDLERADGNTTIEEQIIIVSLATQRRVKALFEFGTFDGTTTANLATNLPDSEILTIDLPSQQESSALLRLGNADRKFIRKERIGAKLGGFPQVTKLYGDTARFDFSPWYGTRDFVFVDACHEYEYVRNDTEAALRLLKPGGTIVWHDYGGWMGVTRALNEYYATDPRLRGLVNVRGTTLAVLDHSYQIR